MNSEYLISVIVPVYNGARYLPNSIGSLIGQTIFDRLEIVCVDDGSTDNSLEILKDYENRYENIKVFHRENAGVSAARNYGIEISTGRYIAFLDADDEASDKLYEKLLSIMESSNADVGIGDFLVVFEDGKCVKHKEAIIKKWDDPQQLMIDFFRSDYICNNVFDKLFKREIIQDVTFPEGYAIGEDMYFVYGALKNAKIAVLDSSEALYRYMIHAGSAMKSGFNEKYTHAVRLSETIMKQEKDNSAVYEYAKAKYINEVCKTMRLLYEGDAQGGYSDLYKAYKDIIRNYRFKDAKEYMNKKHYFAFVLMRISPFLYDSIYKFLRVG